MPGPTIARLPVEIKILDVAFRSYACPRCGTESPRHDRAMRHVIEPGLDRPVVLQILLGVYRCPSCKTEGNFRTPLPFVGKWRRYVDRARQKVVESVDLDQMPIGKVVARMRRDFHLPIAPSTGWEWHRAGAPTDAAVADYEHLVAEKFSGVLCVDEVYDGEYAVLVACDPLAKRTVAYELCEGVNQVKVKAFFERLKALGIEPDVVNTDGSNLYPKVLAEVWPACRHQLCRFHWTRDLVVEVVKGVRDYRATLPEPEKRERKGRPTRTEGAAQQARAEAHAAREAVRKGRFLLVTRPENLGAEARPRLDDLLAAHPPLAVMRAFMVEFYGIFEGKPRPKTAKARWTALVTNPAYTALPYLAGALRALGDEAKFEKVCVFLRYGNLDSTSNAPERDNRGFRKRQNAHYKLRNPESIRILLRRRLLRDGPPEQQVDLKGRFGNPNWTRRAPG